MATFVKIKRHVKTADGYKTVSQWTNANSVEMDNGSTLPQKITQLESAATTAANGQMTSEMVAKLESIETSANRYVLPNASGSTKGGVKIGSNISVSSGTISLNKENVEGALGYTPSQTDTTYGLASDLRDGLMSSGDYTKLAGVEAGANKYTHPTAKAYEAGLYKISVNELGHVNWVNVVEKSDITALGIPAEDTNTTYGNMTGASASAAGAAGLVPAPASGAQAKFLRGDGTWQTPSNTTYGVATSNANGLMSSTDFNKLAGIESGANKYTHPTATSHASGLYKVTVDGTGHVTGATAVAKADITALGIPAQDTNTTYAVATASANGLMSSGDFTKLAGIAAGAQVNSITGVKGNAESSYRTGNVNITPANIGAIASSEKGAANGVVPLNASKLIDSTYLPSYVDDVLEFPTRSDFPATGESGKIYIDISENDTYRWSGSTYVLIGKNTNTTYSLIKSGNSIKLVGSDGSETSATDSNTTYAAATASANGLMTSAQFNKLAGIADGANNYVHPTATSRASGLYKITVDGTGHVTSAASVVKSDITALGIPAQDTNTTYGNMTGATSAAAGAAGLVPAPTTGNRSQFLRGDGTWASPGNTTYAVATSAANGLMSSTDFSKLAGIAAGANNYVHPTATSRAAGLYKVTVDGTGHVTGATAVAKADITGLGIPAQDTTYAVATASANGLMSSGDYSKLSGIAAGANNYVHPTATSRAAGLYKITVDGTGHVTDVTNVAKADITALGIPSSNTTYAVATSAANGLMSSSDFSKLSGIAAGANKYTHPTATSRASGLYKITVDGTGHVTSAAAVTKTDITSLGIPAQDTNTTYGNMKGASASAAGTAGLVPAPASGAQAKFLRGDGTWVVPTNTTYAVATASANGLMSSTDFSKLSGIAAGANNYVHPTATSRASGLYKVTVDGTGHVTGATAVAKADITALGIPAQDTNTTYGNMTAATSAAAGAAGLVPAPGKGAQASFLRGDGTWVVPTNTTYGSATTAAAGLVKVGSNISVSSGTISLASSNVTGALGFTPVSVNTTYGDATTGAKGIVKIGSNITVSSGTISLASSNVTAALGFTPASTNTTYGNMKGASASANGAAGLVPAPGKGAQAKFLRGDGTWVVPTNTTYGNATTAAAGLVKIGSNISVSSGTISLTNANVTAALGYSPTTYGAATSAALGLVKAAYVSGNTLVIS